MVKVGVKVGVKEGVKEGARWGPPAGAASRFVYHRPPPTDAIRTHALRHSMDFLAMTLRP